jgi:hypothetical protein
MVSPVLDEEHIQQLLKAPATADYINSLQYGAAAAVMDLYDRKVTRGEMAEGINRCLILYAHCAKLYMLKNVEAVFQQGALEQTTFATAEVGLTELMRRQSEAVVDMVERLKMCSSDEDPIH